MINAKSKSKKLLCVQSHDKKKKNSLFFFFSLLGVFNAAVAFIQIYQYIYCCASESTVGCPNRHALDKRKKKTTTTDKKENGSLRDSSRDGVIRQPSRTARTKEIT